LTFPCTHTGAQWVICNDGYIMYVDEQLECESLLISNYHHEGPARLGPAP